MVNIRLAMGVILHRVGKAHLEFVRLHCCGRIAPIDYV